MSLRDQKTWKFLLKSSPLGGLEIWGLTSHFNFEQKLSFELVQSWVTRRELLYFSFANFESGLESFFTHLKKGFLAWHDIPFVFLSSDPALKDREVAGNKIFYIPEKSTPKEFRFVREIETTLGSEKCSASPLLGKEKLLLHVCCGPDAAGVVKQLKEDFELTCFWYDPNIQPQEEYLKRLEAFRKVMRIYDIPFIEGPYDVESFEDKIKGLEWSPEQGAKCSLCYDMRLEKSAVMAKETGFDCYATTLAISPHKVQKKLIQFGELYFKKLGVRYFHQNFMKHDGFKESVEFTRTHDIFRQDYCGCFYSLHEGGPEARQTAERLGYLPSGGIKSSPSKNQMG